MFVNSFCGYWELFKSRSKASQKLLRLFHHKTNKRIWENSTNDGVSIYPKGIHFFTVRQQTDSEKKTIILAAAATAVSDSSQSLHVKAYFQ